MGGARTALFNWLYARRHGGTFVLRIEDTDLERSSDAMVAGILDSLRWLGLDWDEGPIVGGPHEPYYQAQRRARHRAVALNLVEQGQAYYCYCTPEDLQAKRDAAEAAGGAWLYDGACRRLSADEVARREALGRPRAVRLAVPPGTTTFEDQVHGAITVPHETLDDFILLRSDGTPTYQLSVVADDVDMGISLVVRGDDHISNTPKQILLYRAMGAPVPSFAHVPLILGPDKKRLSKRHGATSVGEYEKQGYLPQAMVNFLALLGWSPGAGNQELFSREELIARFTLEGISGGNAVFNPEKLDWFNQQYIMKTSPAELARAAEPYLRDAALWHDDLASSRAGWFERVIALLQPRVKTLGDFASGLRPFLADTVDVDPAARAKHLGDAALAPAWHRWREVLSAVEPFEAPPLEAAPRQLATDAGMKPGSLIHATRVAVVGQAASPGLFEVLELVGRERVLARVAVVEPGASGVPGGSGEPG